MAYSLDGVVDYYDSLLSSELGPVALEGKLPSGGYMNLGYWDGAAGTLAEAGDALVDRLLAFLPEKRGRILDVACGLGATTRRLTRFYRPCDVTAINLGASQLARARSRAPGCRFVRMDAARLAFPDASFDAVISVEAASHFRTRARFLREAHRVLAPGGRLVMSDMPLRLPVAGRVSPRQNVVRSRRAYAAEFAAAGFGDVRMLDATRPVVWGFLRHWAPRYWGRIVRHPGRLGNLPFALCFPALLLPSVAACLGYFLICARR